MAVAVRVRITGRVQGVGYRAWVVRTARGHGLAGWVCNRADGSVEALFSGAADDVSAMVDACWRGPGLAAVRMVTSSPAAAPDGTGFEVRPTV